MQLQGDEQVLFEARPDPHVLWNWAFTRALPTGLAAAFLVFWCYGFFRIGTEGEQVISRGAIAGGVSLLPFTIVGFIYAVWARRTYVYYVTDRRCVFVGGPISRVERSIPYHQIIAVDLRQNPIEKWTGLWSIKLFIATACVSAGRPTSRDASITFWGLRDGDTVARIIQSKMGRS